MQEKELSLDLLITDCALLPRIQIASHSMCSRSFLSCTNNVCSDLQEFLFISQDCCNTHVQLCDGSMMNSTVNLMPQMLTDIVIFSQRKQPAAIHSCIGQSSVNLRALSIFKRG